MPYLKYKKPKPILHQEVFFSPQNGTEYTIIHFKCMNDKPITSEQYIQINQMLNEYFNKVVNNG